MSVYEKVIIFPKKLNNDAPSYKFLSELQEHIRSDPEASILFDMSECEFCHAIFTSFLGTMLRVAEHFGKKATICTKINSKVETYLKRSGLYSYVTNDPSDYTNENTLPFCRISSKNEEDVLEYIENIINHAPVRLTEPAHELLFQNIYEVFCNASEHSREDLGVYACGHWMPNTRDLVFSIYDTGIGIPSLVKETIVEVQSSEEAILWALRQGNSTKQLEDGVPRGLGLSKLLSFILLNKGRLDIFSNDICYSFNKGHSYYFSLPNPIMGTFIGITIVADNVHIYSTSKEIK